MSQSRPLVFSLLVFVLLLPAVVLAQQPTTKTFHLTLRTRVDAPMRMMGMPDMQIPGMPTGEPQRSVIGRAVYEEAAVEPIFVTVPEDLQFADNRLVLRLPVPVTAEEGEDEGNDDETPEKTPDMEMTNTLYWHPDEARGPVTETFTVEGGQGSAGGMGMTMPDLSRIVQEVNNREAEGSEVVKPKTVVGRGDYVLNTAGTATLDGFLPPLQMISPDMSQLAPAQGITVQWEPIAGARGYLVSAVGTNMDGDEDAMKMTIISWYSTINEPPMRIRGGYQQETTIADDLRDGVLLPGDTTSCVVPAGIFDDIMMLTITVEAIGNDFYSNEQGTTVFGTIRSEWSGMGMIMDMGA